MSWQGAPSQIRYAVSFGLSMIGVVIRVVGCRGRIVAGLTQNQSGRANGLEMTADWNDFVTYVTPVG